MDAERIDHGPEAPATDEAEDASNADATKSEAEAETREIIERYRETFDELAK